MSFQNPGKRGYQQADRCYKLTLGRRERRPAQGGALLFIFGCYNLLFMKRLQKVIAGIAIVIAVLFITAKIRGDGYLFKGLWACYLHGTKSASIDDARFFNTHKIESAREIWEWPLHGNYNQLALPAKLQSLLSQTGSVAFLIVQNDSILSEHYWDSYSDSSQSNSFSMAKSITTMLAQIAIQKGILQGWHQKVKSILPDLTGPHAGELELWHLSTMSSGLEWDEDYKNPWTVTAKAYYGDDVRQLMLTLPIADEPGKFYNYQSGSTQLLALCLIQVSGKPLSELASEWLWKPMQAKHDAKWHTDEKGTELAYCCFNSNARDFARFGKLMLHQGNWNGKQLLDTSFVQMATTGALVPYYGYSFWLDNSAGTKVFFQWGFLGQYIITIPEYNLVIVRLGNDCLPDGSDHLSEDFHIIVQEVLKMVKAH
jgi:CubicO group peptidase (beta-lactamase class C family)